MQGCLASRHCLSFTVWGFDDAQLDDIPDLGSGPGREALAAIHDANYRPKPGLPGPAVRAGLGRSLPVLPRVTQRPER